MGWQAEQWFERFSDDWWDLTTLRGLLGGILGSLVNLTAFLLIVSLGILVAGVRFEGGSNVSTITFWLAVISGGLAGVSFVSLGMISRVRQFWRTFGGRLLTNLIKYGGFVGLLFVAPFLTFVAGFSFVFGRIIAHVAIFLSGQNRTSQHTD